MSAENITNFDKARATFAGITCDGSPWLAKFRETSYDNFRRLGFPTRKLEDWKYTSFRKFKDIEFDYLTTDSLNLNDFPQPILVSGASIVFNNGCYSEKESNLSSLEGLVEVIPLSDYIVSHEAEVKELLAKDSKASLTSLNSAFLGQGVYIKILSDAQTAPEINIMYRTSANASASSSFVRNFIKLDEGSKASICESFIGEGEQYFNNTITNYDLASGSYLDYCRIESGSSGASQFSEQRFVLGAGSTLNSFVFNERSSWSRSNLSVNLTGAGAEVTLNGVYLPCDSQLVDHHTSIVHEVPDTKSSQLYKGILKDKGRAVFSGRIEVKPNAARTSAFQLNKNLMLSNEAEVDTTPQLQIDNSDVKCSHGATVGQLNEDEVFYLQSRGLRKSDAKQLLCKAYVSDVLQNIRSTSVRDYLNESLTRFLGKGVKDD